MVNPTFSLGIFTFAGIRQFFLGNRRSASSASRPAARSTATGASRSSASTCRTRTACNPRLTLNAGLRYEFATMPVDIDGRDSALPNLTDRAPTPGQLYQNPTHKNFSPRVGFAWDVFGDGKTSVRGGYGIYFNTNNQQNLIVTVTNPPATPRPVIANPSVPRPELQRLATRSAPCSATSTTRTCRSGT